MTSDLGRAPVLHHLELADCPTYIKTLHQMHIYYPSLVLVPNTFIAATDATLASGGKKPPTTSLLVQLIREEFPNIPVEPVARKYWNDGAGVSIACSRLSVRNPCQGWTSSRNYASRMTNGLPRSSPCQTSAAYIRLGTMACADIDT